LDSLVANNVVEAKILKEPMTFHIIYSTKPKQLWVEEYHKKNYAEGVHYTQEPFEDVWEQLLALFNDLWGNAIDYNKYTVTKKE